MDENTQYSSFDGHTVASTEDGATNINLQQELSNKNTAKSSILESYVIKNNTVK